MRQRVQRGVDLVKVMASGGMTTRGTDVMGTQFTADKMHLLVELAHEAGLPITAHAHSVAAVEAGVDCIEYCSSLTAEGSALSEDLVASIADRDIAISGVLTPIRMDLSQAPPAIRKADRGHRMDSTADTRAPRACCIDYTLGAPLLSPGP